MPPTVAETWAEWKESVRIAAFGTLWSALSGLGPSLMLFIYNHETYEGPPDWDRQAVVFTTGALAGVIGYWRKHNALLKLPPWFKDVPLEVQRAMLANGIQSK